MDFVYWCTLFSLRHLVINRFIFVCAYCNKDNDNNVSEDGYIHIVVFVTDLFFCLHTVIGPCIVFGTDTTAVILLIQLDWNSSNFLTRLDSKTWILKISRISPKNVSEITLLHYICEFKKRYLNEFRCV